MKKKFLPFLFAIVASCGMLMAANPPGLGPFTAGPDKQIYFAPGNLQYQASTDTWRFAPNQYDMIGYDNINISPTYSGWIDMFGWGTGDNPTLNSQSMDDYEHFVDWGINVIDTFPEDTWRTPTRGEWNYVFNLRPNANQLWGCATIRTTGSYVIGLMILPDNWLANGLNISFTPRRIGWFSNANTYDLNTWALMENAGAVFFPAAGFREEIPNTMIKEPNDKGYYWTSTPTSELYNGPLYNGTSQLYNGITQAYDLFFRSDIVDPNWTSLRYRGRSVRLVYVEPMPECAITDTLFIEDFGGNNPADSKIATSANNNVDNAYHQVMSEADLMCGYDNNFQKTYLLTKVGKHAAGWHLQDDHTYLGDTTRGYFMLVDDGACTREPLYTSPVVTVAPGETVNYSAWFANVKTWFGSASNTELTIPSFTISLHDANTGVMLDSYFTGDIPYDNNQPLESDYRNPSPWIKATAEFEVPLNTTRVRLIITPTATTNRWGNDYAIDDISITRCIEYADSLIEGCDSVEYNGIVYYKDTLFVDTDINVAIKIHPSSHTATTITDYDEVQYDGVTYTESTTLINRSTTNFGCEAVDTVHIVVNHIVAEYLDSLIVNEMNWIICCNNRLLRAHYPADTYEYQWYKDGQAVSSYYPDYHDYYTEDRRLQGEFYLIVKAATDVNGTMTYKRVRSNTITIAAPSQVSVSPNPASQGEAIRITAEGPFQYRLVTLSGLCLTAGSAEQNALLPVLPQGIYLVEILQENEVSTLKLMVR